MKAIIQIFWFKYLCIVILVLFEQVMLRNLQPYIMDWIIEYFEIETADKTTQNDVLIYATALIVTIIAISFIVHHINCLSQILGIEIRVACCSLIYKKILKLNKSGFRKTTVDPIVNLLNDDIYTFDLLPSSLNFLWITPIQIVIIFSIVWQSIGMYTIVGFGTLLTIVIPTQSCIEMLDKTIRNTITKLTDKRNQIMKEIAVGIKIIKMYVLEKYFDKIMSEIRLEEVKQLQRSLYIRVLYSCLPGFVHKIMVFMTLVIYSLDGNMFQSKVTYNISVYYHIIQLLTVIYLPLSIYHVMEINTMVKKIQNFLLLDEICEISNNLKKSVNETNLNCASQNETTNAVRVELNNVSASWKVDQLPQTLSGVTLKINSGDLCALIGPANSGKSSLLNLLLQEIPISAGTVGLFQFKNENSTDFDSKPKFIQDNPDMTISYASQDPWLFSGTVRENIIFGLDYDSMRYRQVTRVCSLLRDFNQLPNGDMTIIGDHGEPLSGGQKAKVNLARAIYRQADLYLLDDPLSAIDASVARLIFKECILKFLQGKTRILVTNQLYCLKEAHTIALFERGFIKIQGDFDALTMTSFEFNEMLNTIRQNEVQDYTQIFTNDISEENEINNGKKSTFVQSRYSCQFIPREELVEMKIHNNVNNRIIKKSDSYNLKKINRRYSNSCKKITIFILLLVLYILLQLTTIVVDQWMSYWTTVETIRTCIQAPKDICIGYENQLNSMVDINVIKSLLNDHKLLSANFAIYIYTVFIMGLIGLLFLIVYLTINIFISTGQKLYFLIFSNLLQARMHFFNSHLSDKISTTLLKDIKIMDDLFIPTAIQIMIIIVQTIAIIINIITVIPWIMILVIILGPILYYLTLQFLKTMQNVKQLENITKTPVALYTSATLNGLTTIRSHNKDRLLLLRKNFNHYQEINSGARYLLVSMMSAYSLVIELIFCIFVSVAYFLLIIMHQEKTFNESVGFAISQSLILFSILQNSVKQIIEVPCYLKSISRIFQYVDVPKEGPIESSNPPPTNWPSSGQIRWENISINYIKNGLPVFKNIDLMIEPCWKVGVVERAGTEKSSLISTLFRLVDNDLHGDIIIDGLDTKSIGLQDLRSNISIIPKDPYLFTGTLRYNLDPFQEYTDKAMWGVLGEVELNDMTLDQWISEGGTNFSSSERKLICFARALLRSNRILVLDHITNDLDLNTKVIIQRVIQSYFKYCTIITITDHLDSIINSDIILVMDNGCLVEFGSPYELLIIKNKSIFGQMIKKYDEVVIEKIFQEVIKYHYQQRRYNLRKNNLSRLNNV
ncbi:ATP-binding cassette sub-family C member 4-like isoform X2 [Microplitis demolitor]|nr:ATP-binding cassette sub-family C member 4-like isoform X2 [Microplitis demolitor]